MEIYPWNSKIKPGRRRPSMCKRLIPTPSPPPGRPAKSDAPLITEFYQRRIEADIAAANMMHGSHPLQVRVACLAEPTAG
jgi:hypothetical protein